MTNKIKKSRAKSACFL